MQAFFARRSRKKRLPPEPLHSALGGSLDASRRRTIMITRLSSPAGTAARLGLDERVTMGRRDANRARSWFVAAARGRCRAALPRGSGLAPSSLRAAKRHEETKEKAPATGAAKQEKKTVSSTPKPAARGQSPQKNGKNERRTKPDDGAPKAGSPRPLPPVACVARRRGREPRRAEHGHRSEEKNARAPEWAPRSGHVPCGFFLAAV